MNGARSLRKRLRGYIWLTFLFLQILHALGARPVRAILQTLTTPSVMATNKYSSMFLNLKLRNLEICRLYTIYERDAQLRSNVKNLYFCYRCSLEYIL